MTATIYQIPTALAGSVGIFPTQKFAVVGDNLSTVTTANYFNSGNLESATLSTNDIVNLLYSYNPVTQVGTFEQFSVSVSGTGVITLSALSNAGQVTLPTIANHIATYTNTAGHLSEDPATAISGGNIQAGLSGTAGYLASFPSTGSKGSLRVTAVANSGDTVTTISNAAMGQASVISIPDPAGATANFAVAPAALVNNNLIKASGTAGLVADAGIAASAVATYSGSTVVGNLVKASSTTGQIVDAAFALHAGTTSAYAGGGTSNAFTTTNMTASSVVTATILSQSGTASIISALPGTNTLTVTFSADPGANTVINWISVTPAG